MTINETCNYVKNMVKYEISILYVVFKPYYYKFISYYFKS